MCGVEMSSRCSGARLKFYGGAKGEFKVSEFAHNNPPSPSPPLLHTLARLNSDEPSIDDKWIRMRRTHMDGK